MTLAISDITDFVKDDVEEHVDDDRVDEDAGAYELQIGELTLKMNLPMLIVSCRVHSSSDIYAVFRCARFS